jgi:hypothetical protein
MEVIKNHHARSLHRVKMEQNERWKERFKTMGLWVCQGYGMHAEWQEIWGCMVVVWDAVWIREWCKATETQEHTGDPTSKQHAWYGSKNDAGYGSKNDGVVLEWCKAEGDPRTAHARRWSKNEYAKRRRSYKHARWRSCMSIA